MLRNQSISPSDYLINHKNKNGSSFSIRKEDLMKVCMYWKPNYEIPKLKKEELFKQFILGHLIGDGHIRQKNHNKVIAFCYSQSIINSSNYDYAIFTLLFIDLDFRATIRKPKSCKNYILEIHINTKGTKVENKRIVDIIDFNLLVYKDDNNPKPHQRKKIPPEFISDLSKYAFALCYLDDGNFKNKNSKYCFNLITLALENFTYNEKLCLIKKIRSLFNVKPTIRGKKRKKRIYLSGKEAIKFLLQIDDFVVISDKKISNYFNTFINSLSKTTKIHNLKSKPLREKYSIKVPTNIKIRLMIREATSINEQNNALVITEFDEIINNILNNDYKIIIDKINSYDNIFGKTSYNENVSVYIPDNIHQLLIALSNMLTVEISKIYSYIFINKIELTESKLKTICNHHVDESALISIINTFNSNEIIILDYIKRCNLINPKIKHINNFDILKELFNTNFWEIYLAPQNNFSCLIEHMQYTRHSIYRIISKYNLSLNE